MADAAHRFAETVSAFAAAVVIAELGRPARIRDLAESHERMSVQAVAADLPTSESTVYRLLNRGQLQGDRLGTRRYVFTASYQALRWRMAKGRAA